MRLDAINDKISGKKIVVCKLRRWIMTLRD